MLCTTTAIDFSCGLLSINATKQAAVGSPLVINVLPTDIVAIRLNENRALVCYSTETIGKCIVVDATVTNGVQLNPTLGSFSFTAGGSKKLSLELNGNDILLCYVTLDSTFCGVASTTNINGGIYSTLNFNEQSTSEVSISIIPSTNRFLTCFVKDVGHYLDESNDGEEVTPGKEITGVGKCAIISVFSSSNRQLFVWKTFFLYGSNPVVTKIGHVVFQPPVLSLPFPALICFSIESFDFEDGGLCTVFEISRMLFSASPIATETFSYSSEISSIVVKNVVRSSSAPFYTALVSLF